MKTRAEYFALHMSINLLFSEKSKIFHFLPHVSGKFKDNTNSNFNNRVNHLFLWFSKYQNPNSLFFINQFRYGDKRSSASFQKSVILTFQSTIAYEHNNENTVFWKLILLFIIFRLIWKNPKDSPKSYLNWLIIRVKKVVIKYKKVKF